MGVDDNTRWIPVPPPGPEPPEPSAPTPPRVVLKPNGNNKLRDRTCTIVGAALLISQIVFQSIHIDPNIWIISAGCALLGAPTFFRIDDRRKDS